MPIIDAHCDVLSKMLTNPEINFFQANSALDVSYPLLKKSQIALQSFAIYLPEKLKPYRFSHVLQSVDIFQQKILCNKEIVFVRDKQLLEKAIRHGKLGAILTLEGVDGLEDNFLNVRILYYLGVRSIGLTWNFANWAADGVLEPRNGGLTRRGIRLVQECESLGIIIDIAHLNEPGFWRLAELTSKPFIASHANVQHICPHPRNLTDSQIKMIIQRAGVIGVTFVPSFVNSVEPVKIEHLLPHIDHICSLGGVSHIGFGSDFDGIDQHIAGLENAGRYDGLANLLSKYYRASEVDKFLFQNWYRFWSSNLP